MRVISNKTLMDFAGRHPAAQHSLQAWRKLVEAGSYRSFADMKATFGSTDKVGDYYVFDIGGNKFRVIAAVHFNRQLLYVRHVFTHKEYDRWSPK